MMDTASSRSSRSAVGMLLVLCVGSAAQAQVGTYSRPSDFYTPSQHMGFLGGRYTGSIDTPGFTGNALAPYDNPLSVKMAPRDNFGAGQRSFGQDAVPSTAGTLPPPIPGMRPIGSPMALNQGMPIGSPLVSPSASSVPEYGQIFIPRPDRIFTPTVRAETFAKAPSSRPASLRDIMPSGPTASAFIKETSPATQPSPELALQVMSERQAGKLSTEGEACLQRAMEALKNGQYRGNRAKPGAIDLFRQARLLLGEKPEPTLGLIASLVSTADYNQAAAMIGPLVRKWPEVMARTDFTQEFYTRPEQMRTHLLAIRDAAIQHGDPDLRLLWAFYRWYGENRQEAAGAVVQIAQQQGPDSSAAVVAAAMGAALGIRG